MEAKPRWSSVAIEVAFATKLSVAMPFVVAMIIGAVWTTHGAAWADEIAWRQSPRPAQLEAQRQSRPLLVYIGTNSCGYCRKLERTTWANEVIAVHVAKQFVPLHVDGSQASAVVRQLGIRAYPTVVIISPDGRLVGRAEGYLSPHAMLRFLRKHMNPDPPALMGRAADHSPR